MRNTPVINLTTYASLKENLAEILPELKEAFIEDGLILLDQIKDNLNQGDSTVIMTAAHTLKSSASNMGADQLAEYCMKIEDRLLKLNHVLPTLLQLNLQFLHCKSLHL